MRKLAGGIIAVILTLGYLAAVLPAVADSPPPGATPDPLSAYETGDKQFQRYDIGNKTVYWHQRMIGDAIVEGDFIRYQFDRDSGTLLNKKTEWRDGLPAKLPPIISREQAEAGIGRDILHSILYIISPDSFVHPIEPTPQNPCWVVTSADDLDIRVDIIDAVTGEYLGSGVPPPYDGFVLSGPNYITDRYSEWAEFDDFRVRRYCGPQPTFGNWRGEEQEGASSPWYNSSWTYRRRGNVTSSFACGNLSDYQMEMRVHYGQGKSEGAEVFLNSSAWADFDDIRFTEGDGVTPLDYWIQDYTAGVNATVWVEFSAISSGGTRFYIYYGNPNASTASDGSSTFIIFNNGSSIDGWSVYPSGKPYDWVTYNGTVRCNVTNASGGWSNLYYEQPIGTDFYVAESKIRAGRGLIDPSYQQGIGYGTANPMARWLETYNKWNLRDPGGSSYSAVDDTFDARKWHDYSFVKNGTSWELFIDGDSKVIREASSASGYTGMYVFMTGNNWLGLYQNAESWFKKMGYSTEAVEYPGEGKIGGHMQSSETALFYAIAHGDSMRFVSGFADVTHVHEIHYWLEHYAKIPFVFLGNCGAMCDMARGSTSYEFRKGSTENTTAVGYYAMSLESCGSCWANSRVWQDTLFNFTNQSYTVKQAFDEANAAYPVCIECTRFIGDDSFKLVPVVSRGAAEPTPTPTATAPPQWVSMNSNVKWELHSVWGSSSSDVFAVGETGTIVHYNGVSWSPMASKYTKSLRTVWGNSSTDVFTAGVSATIMHYNGSSWSLMDHNATTWFILVQGNSSSNVFAIGDHGDVLRYDGGNWSIVVDSNLERLYGAWGTSPSDVFATGVEGNIWHCNGSGWSDSGSGTAEWLTGMWGSSPSDVFAVGDHGTILHYNGSAWSAMDSGTSEWLWGIWGSSSSDVFVVGTAGTILHYNGSTWSGMSSGTAEWLYGVWGSSSSDVFAVGNKGTILHYSRPGSTPTPTATSTATATATPTPTPGLLSEVHTTGLLTYNTSNHSIDFSYNVFNELYMTEVASSPLWDGCNYKSQNTCQAGDPALLYDSSSGFYYLNYRYKSGGRFSHHILIKTQDFVNWTTVWNYSAEQFQRVDLGAIERSALLEHQGRYYLYFAWEPSGKECKWRNSYIQATTIEELGNRLINATYWHNVSYPGFQIGNVDDKVQVIYKETGPYGAQWLQLKNYMNESQYTLVGAYNISGPWFNVSRPGLAYCAAHGCLIDGSIKPTLLVKDSNGKYIVWGYDSSTEIYYWWWEVSDDLINWTYVSRLNAGYQEAIGFGSTGQRRMPVLVDSPTGNHEVMFMQWWLREEGKTDSIVMWQLRQPTWLDRNLPYRIPVTINHSMVWNPLKEWDRTRGKELVEFPVLVTSLGIEPCNEDFWGKVNYNQSLMDAGLDPMSDIIVGDKYGNRLSHELVYINRTSKEIELWVKIPELSTGLNTTFYLYYGNESYASPNDVETWDKNFTFVSHMTSQSSTVTSSTRFDTTCSMLPNSPVEAVGIVGSSQYFDGTNQDIVCTYNPTFVSKNLTAETWFNAVQPQASAQGFLVGRNNTFLLSYDHPTNADARGALGVYIGVPRWPGGTSMSSDTWNYFVGRLKFNGSSYNSSSWLDSNFGTGSSYTGILGETSSNLYLGQNSSNGGYFYGSVDEIRLSNISRPDSWLLTTHNSIRYQDLFIIEVGCQEDVPTTSELPTPTPRPGDANGDGIINAADITKVERIILVLDDETPGADANGDGEVDAADIGVIEYMILGIWPWNHVHIEAPSSLPGGADFTATVFITYVEGFGSASLEVSYNDSVICLDGVTNGKLMEIDPGVSADFYTVAIDGWSQPGGAGTLQVNAGIDGNPGPDGAGYLCKLQFHVIGSAGQASPIAFNVPQSWLKDSGGGEITATWADDSVTVAP